MMKATEINTNNIHQIESGDVNGYEVFIYKVVNAKNDNGQTFIISHNGETTTVAVDFTKGESGWVSLGEFHFNAAGNEAVEVKSSGTRGNIRTSSVKWMPVKK